MNRLLFATIAVWMAALPGTAVARTWLSSQQSGSPAWHEVPAASVATQAVRLRNHLNGILAAKCQATYTRNLAGVSLRVWVGRHIAAHRAKNACVEVRDWKTAVSYVQRWFPGTSQWLMSCSSSEGGHGSWVPNRQGSGAGGWMQYMETTFWSDYRSAVAYLATRGVHVPSSSASWTSPLGQAIAAGWARYTGNIPRGKWTGSGC